MRCLASDDEAMAAVIHPCPIPMNVGRVLHEALQSSNDEAMLVDIVFSHAYRNHRTVRLYKAFPYFNPKSTYISAGRTNSAACSIATPVRKELNSMTLIIGTMWNSVTPPKQQDYSTADPPGF